MSIFSNPMSASGPPAVSHTLRVRDI